jgi:hypothetical protein
VNISEPPTGLLQACESCGRPHLLLAVTVDGLLCGPCWHRRNQPGAPRVLLSPSGAAGAGERDSRPDGRPRGRGPLPGPGGQNVTFEVLQGDARAVLAGLPPDSIQCVVTSIPYWGLRAEATP